MTDRDDLGTDEQERVRRLLAEARHTDPMPDAVVARLDRVLADLGDEPRREATVVRLADRRRRAGTMLIAAAAVVVAGIGLNQVLDGVSGESEMAATDSAESGDAPAAAEARPQEDGDDVTPGGAVEDGSALFDVKVRDAALVRPAKFAADVGRIKFQAALQATRGDTAEEEAPEQLSQGYRAAVEVCGRGDWGKGRYQPVRYGRSPGYLIFRPVAGDTQIVDLFLCGSEQAVRSITLPVR